MKKDDKIQARPFISGQGKTQLLDECINHFPRLAQRKNLTYVEPFVGGGAVLFKLLWEYPNIKKAVINDINQDLINTYRVVKEELEALIDELSKIQAEYLQMGENERKEYFLTNRALFNSKRSSKVKAAALFIFLNRTCFNGLYRVNSKGEFNVPRQI